MKATRSKLIVLSGLLLTAFLIVASHITLEQINSISAEAWSAIAAFLSFFVACIALYTSYYQIKSSERSARLSIKPHCVLICVVSNTDGVPVGVHFRNNGLGPAIIVEWTFTINGTLIPEKNEDGLKIVINRYGLFHIATAMLLPPGTSLGANQTEKMVVVPFDRGLTEMFDGTRASIANSAMEKLMREVNFILRFTSAYEDEQTISLHLPKLSG